MEPIIERGRFDSPWKDSMDVLFPHFMAYVNASAHALIDWSRRWRPLDTELHALLPDSATGSSSVDKLMEVHGLDGALGLVLVHVEVQGSSQPDFARRMYRYHYRIEDHWKLPVVSMAVLTDERPNWKPNEYTWSLWGCELTFRYPVVKLTEDQHTVDDLRTEPNPFAVIAVAHKQALETRGNWNERERAKLEMAMIVAERAALDPALPMAMPRDIFLHSIRMIDWILELPWEHNLEWRKQVDRKLEERHMPWLSVFEREAAEKAFVLGSTKGTFDVISLQIRQKFGQQADALIARLSHTTDLASLQAVASAVMTAATPDDVLAVLPPNGVTNGQG